MTEHPAVAQVGGRVPRAVLSGSPVLLSYRPALSHPVTLGRKVGMSDLCHADGPQTALEKVRAGEPAQCRLISADIASYSSTWTITGSRFSLLPIEPVPGQDYQPPQRRALNMLMALKYSF